MGASQRRRKKFEALKRRAGKRVADKKLRQGVSRSSQLGTNGKLLKLSGMSANRIGVLLNVPSDECHLFCPPVLSRQIENFAKARLINY